MGNYLYPSSSTVLNETLPTLQLETLPAQTVLNEPPLVSVQNETQMQCFKCEVPHKATYRCRFTTSERNYEMLTEVDAIKKSEYTDDSKNALILLLTYRCCVSFDGKYNHISFVACDQCITPEIKKYFTYVPEGWEDCENYELINLP